MKGSGYQYRCSSNSGVYLHRIFELYLGGQSVLGVVKELEKRKILSPTGKEKWCKRTIDVMLSNEKYTGDVKLLKSGNSDVQYMSTDNHKAIISKEIFEALQIEVDGMVKNCMKSVILGIY